MYICIYNLSPDEWATTKQACRDKLLVFFFFFLPKRKKKYIYIYIHTYTYTYMCRTSCLESLFFHLGSFS